MTSLIPIFDSLGKGDGYKFELEFTKRDQVLLLQISEGKDLEGLAFLEGELAKLKQNLNKYFTKLSPSELVFSFCLFILPIYFLKMICLAGTIYFVNSSGLLSIRDIRRDLYVKLQHLPLDEFVTEKTGIWMSRVINDVDTIGKVVSNDLKDAVIDFFYIVTHLALLLFLSWKLFFLIFLVVPLIFGPVSAFSERIRKTTKNQQERLAGLNGDLQEVIAGIRVIRAFSMEARESDRFYEVNNDLSKKTFQTHFYHQVGPALIELSGSLVTVVFLGIGAFLLEEPGFSRGMFLAFFLTLIFLMRPFKQMSILMNLLKAASSAGDRVFGLLKERDSMADGSQHPGALKDCIEFRNIHYKYPKSEKWVLDGIELKIPKGANIALVGQSGAGKTSLVDLLPRLMDPTLGQVLWDGLDIREIALQNLRNRIAIVSQNIFLFNGTIEENIAYGSWSATSEEIRNAALEANATSFIEEFEEGFHTRVGERGVMLSGGQRQRISIARAILADPEVLILDEATSALDTESELLIQQAFVRLYKNRTVIVIAHRLSTVKIADQIYYMEEGKIVEQGTHNELIGDTSSRYKKLYEMQYSLA